MFLRNTHFPMSFTANKGWLLDEPHLPTNHLPLPQQSFHNGHSGSEAGESQSLSQGRPQQETEGGCETRHRIFAVWPCIASAIVGVHSQPPEPVFSRSVSISVSRPVSNTFIAELALRKTSCCTSSTAPPSTGRGWTLVASSGIGGRSSLGGSRPRSWRPSSTETRQRGSSCGRWRR